MMGCPTMFTKRIALGASVSACHTFEEKMCVWHRLLLFCYCPIFRYGLREDGAILMVCSQSCPVFLRLIKVWLTAQRPWLSTWIFLCKPKAVVPNPNAPRDVRIAAVLLSREAEMSEPTRGPAKHPKHGEIGCEISARVTDKRNWVLCRTCLNTQHSQTQGKSKALTGYFRPIIISHKSQTSQDHCLWQHDWWVCRCECQEKWSPAPYLPYFSLWGSLGVFMEKSHIRCDEHYSVIMKGTLLYCQRLQTGRDPLAAERPSIHAIVCPRVFI